MPLFDSLRKLPFASRIAFGLGLACAYAAIHYGFAAGPVNETHRVTVVHVVDHRVQIPASPGGPRIGGSPARSEREYRVMCRTLGGQECTVVTEPYVQYRTGELITAEVELNKPEGPFGWTFNCRLFAWLSLLALLWGLWRGRRAWAPSAPIPTYPPVSAMPVPPTASDPTRAALFHPAKTSAEHPTLSDTGHPDDPTHL